MNAWTAPATLDLDSLPHNAAPSELMRFAQAVSTEGKSLMVVRSSSEELDTLSDHLQSLWRTHAPNVLIEHYSGRHSAGLLGLVNATLAERPLHLAMQAESPTDLQKLCLVRDAECLTAPELLLLQRVIDGFPGWRIGLVLLFKTTLDTSEKLSAVLNAPSKNLMIWQMHSPAAPAAAPRPSPKGKLWLAGLLGLAVLGGVVLTQRAPSAPNTPETPLLAQTTPARPEPTTASAPQVAKDLGETSAQTTPAAESTLPASAPQAPASVPATESASASAPAPSPAASVAATTPPSATAPTQLPPIPEAAQRGYRWLAALPKDYFLILHGSHSSALQAKRQIDSKPELVNARMVMLKPTDTESTRFWVITGPFRSQERAENFRVRQNLPVSTLILEAGDVLKRSRPVPKAKAD